MEPILLDVPEELSTQRLSLRRPRMGDGALINPVIVESASELAPYMPWATPTPEVDNTEQWVRRSLSKFYSREQFDYLIFLKNSDTYLGTCSLHRIEWKVPRCEVGYWMRTSQNGKGYMSEATRELTRMGLEVLKLARVELRCDEANARSRRVAERSGFTLEGILRNEARAGGKLRNTCVFAVLPQGI